MLGKEVELRERADEVLLDDDLGWSVADALEEGDDGEELEEEWLQVGTCGSDASDGLEEGDLL